MDIHADISHKCTKPRWPRWAPAQMGGIVISDELVERTRVQQREAEATLRAKRDAQAHGDADGELARLAQALTDLGRRASELRQVHAL